MSRRLLVLAICAASLPVFTGCEGNVTASQPPETKGASPARRLQVEVAPVDQTAFSADLAFTGNLLPRRMTRIVPQVDGVVQSITAMGPRFQMEVAGRRYDEQLSLGFGQAVKAGDVLVRLDPRDFEMAVQLADARQRQAEADLAKLKAWQRPEEVQRLAALKEEAEAKYGQAYRTYERAAALTDQNVISQSEYDRVVTDVNTAKALLDSAAANLASAKAGPTQEELAVQEAYIAHARAEADMKRLELEKTTIRAPYDGVVTAVHVEVGERVSGAQGPAVELMDLRYLIAEVGVPAAYVGKVQVKDRASVSTVASTSPVPAVVIAVNEVVDPSSRAFQVRVAIDNAEGRFKAGQFAKVHFKLAANQSGAAVTVPSKAIVFVEGQPHVYVLNGERVELTAVQLGLVSGDQTQISSGLQPGQQVVVNDPNLLSDGMRVAVKP